MVGHSTSKKEVYARSLAPSTCQAHAPSRSPRSSDMGSFPHASHPSIHPSVRVGHASDITLNLIVPLPLNPPWTRDDPSNGRQTDSSASRVVIRTFTAHFLRPRACAPTLPHHILQQLINSFPQVSTFHFCSYSLNRFHKVFTGYMG